MMKQEMMGNTKEKKKWNDDTFITEYIMKFKRPVYETVMCVLAAAVFFVPVVKLVLMLGFDYWNEPIWQQVVQIIDICMILAMVLYVANTYYQDRKGFGKNVLEYLKRSPWLFLGLFMIFWMFLSYFINGKYEDSEISLYTLYGYPNRNEGIIFRSLSIIVMIGMVSVADYVKKMKTMRVIVGVTALLGIPVMAQRYDWLAELLHLSGNKAFEYMTQYGIYASSFQNSNHCGYFFCTVTVIAAGLFLHEKKRGLRILFGVIYFWDISVLVANDTLGGFLGAFLALIVLLIFFVMRRGKEGICMAGITLLIFIAAGSVTLIAENAYHGQTIWQQMFGIGTDVKVIANDWEGEEASHTGTGRWALWKVAFEFIGEHPLVGGCEEGMTNAYVDAGILQKTRPANEYLQYASFYGIPFLLAYLAILIIICHKRLKEMKTMSDIMLVLCCAVLAYAISAFFGNTTMYVTSDFFILLGLAGAYESQNSKYAQKVPEKTVC